MSAVDALDLDALQALADKATPGPWEADGFYVFANGDDAGWIADLTDEGNDDEADRAQDFADTAFIAAARSAVPELIAEVARLKSLLAEFGSGPPKDKKSAMTEDELRARLSALADDWWNWAPTGPPFIGPLYGAGQMSVAKGCAEELRALLPVGEILASRPGPQPKELDNDRDLGAEPWEYALRPNGSGLALDPQYHPHTAERVAKMSAPYPGGVGQIRRRPPTEWEPMP